MIRFEIVVLALALGVTSVACGGSQAPAKDPSTDPAAAGPAPESASKPPPQQESPGLGGTGTGSAQGSGALGR
ncbi:MAG TPA: hypothetical protein VGL19_16375 [Polyangiaceae bacterium]|jgi:hypothetical protein